MHEAVDLSVELKQSGGKEEQNRVNHLWEEFLGDAWGILRKRVRNRDRTSWREFPSSTSSR